MEIRQLNTFIRVAQLESFSKAAESLDYSQSAVTVQICQLEEELNTRLFDRMGKHIALTDQGRKFLGGAYNTLYEANRAKLSVGEEQELSGHLYIGAIASLCAAALPPILRRFRTYHPRVEVTITTDFPEELIGKMELGELDIIYILDEPRYNNHWHKLMERREEIVFAASNELAQRLQEQGPLRVEDLLDQPFFLTEGRPTTTRLWTAIWPAGAGRWTRCWRSATFPLSSRCWRSCRGSPSCPGSPSGRRCARGGCPCWR